MSEAIGPIAVIPRDGSPFPGVSEISPETQKLLDDEVRRIVATAHEQVVVLLRTNRSKLDALAEALLEHETLDEDDAYKVAGVPRRDPSPGVSLSAAARSRLTPPQGAAVDSNPKRGD
jgi:cell division protease FtsH